MDTADAKTQLARAWWQAVYAGRLSAHQRKEPSAMASQMNIDQLQAEYQARIRAQSREAAVRALLTHLDPHDDDGQQAYPEILRRVQQALAQEMHQAHRGKERAHG